jgi:hypothetical protein
MVRPQLSVAGHANGGRDRLPVIAPGHPDIGHAEVNTLRAAPLLD